MINKYIKKLKSEFSLYKIDGYIIPKNDNFFSENVKIDRLRSISNFSGSAGFAIILRSKNLLFVDGRYTIQAKKQAGKQFRIYEIPAFLPKNILKNKILGFDSDMFTKLQLNYFFGNNLSLKPIKKNLIDKIFNFKSSKKKEFYSIPNFASGKSHLSKISEVSKVIKRNKSDYLYISAPENVAWLLNIRGSDVPFSPLPNCNCIITRDKKVYLIVERNRVNKLISEKKLKENQIIEPKKLNDFLYSLSGRKFIIDSKTCSVFKEKLVSKKFDIKSYSDPCYLLKALKNSVEINNMVKSHVEDGVALTKFLYWIKNKKPKNLTEIKAEKKLESFRKKNKNYLYPSFNTIAGTGSNGAIIHYRASKKSNKIIKKSDIFLCDSGGQYKYGTTDVTRTICFISQPKKIKKIFTLVLKGHIAVVSSNISKVNSGKKLDFFARKYLKRFNLDYKHGTGHGVGCFLNVHEGPQSISRFNNIKFQRGMILSNEPGYYEEGKFGIRIENLIYIKQNKKKLFFENLTLAPIDKDLIDYNLLTTKEKDYLLDYHLNVYSKLSKYLNVNEKKWLIKNL